MDSNEDENDDQAEEVVIVVNKQQEDDDGLSEEGSNNSYNNEEEEEENIFGSETIEVRKWITEVKFLRALLGLLELEQETKYRKQTEVYNKNLEQQILDSCCPNKLVLPREVQLWHQQKFLQQQINRLLLKLHEHGEMV